MSVYIKRTYIPDMNTLPATCAQCPLIGYDPRFEWDDNGRSELGAYRCNITGELISNTTRTDHCPLYEKCNHKLNLIHAVKKLTNRKD